MGFWRFMLLGLLATARPALGCAQRLHESTGGTIAFTSNAPLEIIRANSAQVRGKLDAARRIFAFQVPMQSFNGFNSGLQRQHFNESYVESEKYPTATFSGRIIEEVDLTRDGTYTVRAKGKLNIHGVSQERIIPSRVVVRGGVITIRSEFEVPLADHAISIPTVVNRKIAEVIRVQFACTLRP